MVTSALVVTLDRDTRKHCTTMDVLACDRRLVLGELAGVRLPVVAETTGLAAAEALVEELSAIDGVVFVDVVLVDFDPDHDIDGAAQLGKRRHGPA